MRRREAGSSGSGGGGDGDTRLAQREDEMPDLSMVLINAGLGFVKRNKTLTGMWITGLILLLFATGFSVSTEQEVAYNRILSKIDDRRFFRAEQEVMQWEERYYQSKGFFSCDAKCMENYNNLLQARRRLEDIKNEDDATLSTAKAEVGLFSTYGVEEAKEMFWSIFSKGKAFGQRASWYDMIFMGISATGRDENLLSVLIRWLFQLIMNFTIGMIGSLFAFTFSLWGLISSYQPSFLAGILFFFCATLAASSMIISFLVSLYAAAAGSAFVVVKAAGPNLRIGGPQRPRPMYIRADHPRFHHQQHRY